jgi:rubredoxin
MPAALAHRDAVDEPRYWLGHCEGFEVHDPLGLLGWVDAVELDSKTQSVRALLVSPSHLRPGSLRVFARAVRLVAADRGLVLVGSEASAGRAFGCAACGYGAGGPTAPERCPMCGGTVWTLLDRARRSER